MDRYKEKTHHHAYAFAFFIGLLSSIVIAAPTYLGETDAASGPDWDDFDAPPNPPWDQPFDERTAPPNSAEFPRGHSGRDFQLPEDFDWDNAPGGIGNRPPCGHRDRQITAVPAPGSILLGSVGLGLVGLMRKRNAA